MKQSECNLITNANVQGRKMNLNPFSSSFYQNPADKAMPYMDQVPGTITPYYQPYVDAGTKSLSDLMNQYSSLINDPGAVMNNIGSGFQQSPGYQFQMNQGMNAVNNAAAAGGTLGTTQHENDAAKISSNLANQDYYNYLSNALDLYGNGIKGEQGTMQLGYHAGDELANSLSSNLLDEAGLAYKGQANENAYNSSMFNNLLKTGGEATGWLTGKGSSNKNSNLDSLLNMGGEAAGLLAFL